MPRSLLHAGRYLLVVALFVALGGHWAILQTIAWGTMLVDYSQEKTVVAAVKMTFDGQHPCAICKQVQKGSPKEKKPEVVMAVKQAACCPVANTRLQAPPQESWILEIADAYAGARSRSPAVPPPRLA